MKFVARWASVFMKLQTFTFGLFLSAAIFLFAQHKDPHAALAPQTQMTNWAAVLDLTHSVSEASPNWEGTEKSPFEARPLGDMKKHGYFTRHISLPEHFSTHIDAPAHFWEGAWTVDQIPTENLTGPLVVINVRKQAMKNPDYEVSMDDIAAWEKANGRIPDGAIVMAATGWDEKWRSMKEYRGADEKGTMHFPGFSLEAVKFLVEARRVPGIGIDTMGVDYGKSEDYPIHKYTGSKNVYHLENVAGLTTAPEKGAMIVAAPAKLKGGSGGPVRIFAFIPKTQPPATQSAD